MIAEEDKVVTFKTFHGTHRGEFMGIPPTGRTIALHVIDIMRVVDGAIVEHRGIADRRNSGP
ncbi:MAG TPA: ester cyclase, partial [Gaiellaceae bacterium]|nr:ester cyclase [Gaiellaceae bacterium]